MSYEWREKKPGEWWMVFTDAPDDMAEPDERGVTWPPSLTVSFPADEKGAKFWTGCLHLYSWHNGEMPGEEETDPDYLHICDLDDTIAELTLLRDTLKARNLLPTEEEASAKCSR